MITVWFIKKGPVKTLFNYCIFAGEFITKWFPVIRNQKYSIFFGTISPVNSAWLLWFFASHESPVMKLWQAKWCPQQHLCHLTVYSGTKFIWLEQSKQFCLKHHQQEKIHLPKLHLLFSINRKTKKISRNVKTQKDRSVKAVLYYSRSSLVFN